MTTVRMKQARNSKPCVKMEKAHSPFVSEAGIHQGVKDLIQSVTSHVAYTLGNNILRNSDDGGREEESCYVFTPLKAISNNAKADSLGSGDKGMFSGVLRLRCGETY